MAPMVKNLPAVWETWVQSLGWEDPLQKGIATHSSILAWRIPPTVLESYSPRGCKESDTTERLTQNLVLHFWSISLLKQQARGTNTGPGVYLKITYDMQCLCFENIQHKAKTIVDQIIGQNILLTKKRKFKIIL